MTPIAHIQTPFPTKFGIPRQSGLAETEGKIVFEKEYRNADAFRGLEEYSHIWLLWDFSEAKKDKWSPTVRPPRLGGNKRMGVFATRSPFRPNAIGLSVVQLKKIVLHGENAPYLEVIGADLMDGTPIYDIKPYLPHIDSIPDAKGGFALQVSGKKLEVSIPEKYQSMLTKEQLRELYAVLEEDPRPSYQNDPKREYGFYYSNFEVKFCVKEQLLEVTEICKKS